MRVSTEEQAAYGGSLAMQEERIRAYCHLAQIELVRVVREEGISASKVLGDRPGGADLLTIIETRGAGHIVALKLDRLFRDAADALTRIRAWDRAGVALHLVDMGGSAINTASAMGRMMLTVLAGFAEWERNIIAERTAAVLGHKKARREVYSPTPLGYQRQGALLVEDPSEMLTIQLIHATAAAGGGLRQSAALLNAQHVPTKRGGRWYASTIRYILGNDLYQTGS